MAEQVGDKGRTSLSAGDRLVEARSWVLLEDHEVDFPVVECALLPGERAVCSLARPACLLSRGLTAGLLLTAAWWWAGTGQRWYSGVAADEGSLGVEVKEQIIKSVSCVQQLLSAPGLGMPPGRLVLYDLFDPHPQWDIYVHARRSDGANCGVGLAVVGGLLALAVGRRIEPRTVFSGVSGC